jgi:hypothetical protein
MGSSRNVTGRSTSYTRKFGISLRNMLLTPWWGNRMIISLKDHRLSLSLKHFVAAVSARLPLPKNPGDRRIIEALRTLA